MYKIEEERHGSSAKSYDSIDDSADRFQDYDGAKLCSAYGSEEPVDLKSIKRKIKNPEYVCSSCGRSASDSSSLCSPEEL